MTHMTLMTPYAYYHTDNENYQSLPNKEENILQNLKNLS